MRKARQSNRKNYLYLKTTLSLAITFDWDTGDIWRTEIFSFFFLIYPVQQLSKHIRDEGLLYWTDFTVTKGIHKSFDTRGVYLYKPLLFFNCVCILYLLGQSIQTLTCITYVGTTFPTISWILSIVAVTVRPPSFFFVLYLITIQLCSSSAV